MPELRFGIGCRGDLARGVPLLSCIAGKIQDAGHLAVVQVAAHPSTHEMPGSAVEQYDQVASLANMLALHAVNCADQV